jgi:serine protease Do
MGGVSFGRCAFLWMAITGFCGSVITPSATATELEREDIWKAILTAERSALPADPSPNGHVVWRDNFEFALAEAQGSGRPLLVTWRCLPCQQCAEFDKEILDGSPTLDLLLRRFVTVRLTDASLLDERFFPYRTHQDLDLSWWAYFLSPEGDLYAVFGGKDHVSENTRISETAFKNTLRRVLAHHADPRRSAWSIDRPMGASSLVPRGPRDADGYHLLLRKRPGLEKPHAEFGSCLHCHQVGDMLTMEELAKGSFSVDSFMGRWPLPENVGILLDRDDGLLVKAVEDGSPAAVAGVQPGDRIGMAEQTRLFGQADFRGVLHRAQEADAIEIGWLRDGQPMFGSLVVAPGWRQANNAWRKTVYDGVYGPGMGFFPLNGPHAGKGQGLSIKPWMGPNPAERPVFGTGLRPNMEIVAINDMVEDLSTRELITWFRLNHTPGDEVVYQTRDGKRFRYTLPEE